MATTSPGWYDDGSGALRWWDGQQWTAHVHAPDAAPAAAAEQTAPIAPDGQPAAHDSTPVHDAGAGYPAPAGYPGAGYSATQTYPTAGDPAAQAYVPAPDYAQGGVFTAATQTKSKLWIGWVVLGVVLLGLVVAAAVLIPMLIGLFTPSAATGRGADQQAAVSTVETYDHAWRTANCDEYFAATTESFRVYQQIPDCDTFLSSSANFTDSTQDYMLVVNAVTAEGEHIIVDTTESYVDPLDTSGSTTPIASDYTYTLVSVGGTWLIDDATN